MPDLLKIAAVFLLILLLLRKKFNIGLVMLAASVALFFLYRHALALDNQNMRTRCSQWSYHQADPRLILHKDARANPPGA